MHVHDVYVLICMCMYALLVYVFIDFTTCLRCSILEFVVPSGNFLISSVTLSSSILLMTAWA